MGAEISTRHLSFVETGRSVPSREMVLRLSERLCIPLHERNALLVAAGYAPMYRERALDDPAPTRPWWLCWRSCGPIPSPRAPTCS